MEPRDIEAKARKKTKVGDAYFYFDSYEVPTEHLVVKKTILHLTLSNDVRINIYTGRDTDRDAWAHHRYLPDCPHVRAKVEWSRRLDAAKKTFDRVTYNLEQRFSQLSLEQQEKLNLDLQKLWGQL